MIYLKNVSKTFGKRTILLDINYTIEDRIRITGLIGKNGTGKTTLLKIIAGILENNDGEIVSAEDTNNNYIRWSHRNVVYVSSDERNLFYKNTVKDNILYFCMLKGMDKVDIYTNMDKYFRLLNIDTLINRRIEELSTGQKKMIKILCGLCTDCNYLLLDEPTLGLDECNVQMITKAINLIKNERHIIIASHDLKFLLETAEKFIGFTEDGNFTDFIKNPK